MKLEIIIALILVLLVFWYVSEQRKASLKDYLNSKRKHNDQLLTLTFNFLEGLIMAKKYYEEVTVEVTIPSDIVEKIARADVLANIVARNEIVTEWLNNQLDTAYEIVEQLECKLELED